MLDLIIYEAVRLLNKGYLQWDSVGEQIEEALRLGRTVVLTDSEVRGAKGTHLKQATNELELIRKGG